MADFVEKQEAIGKVAGCFERALDAFGKGRSEALEEMAGWMKIAGMNKLEDVELEDQLVCKFFFVLDKARRDGKIDIDFVQLAGISMMGRLSKKSVEYLCVLGHRESFS
jgi:hypothetical protein